MVVMRSQQTGLVQKKKKEGEKINTNKKEKLSTALVVSDVDSCGERPPLKSLRKVTKLYVFFLVAAPPDGQHKKKKKEKLV